MTPNEVADLVRRTAIEKTIEEDRNTLYFRATLDTEEIRRAWTGMRQHPPHSLRTVTIFEKDSDAYLGDDEVPQRGVVFQFALSKAPSLDALNLFFGLSLESVATQLVNFDSVRIADMEPKESAFTTYRARFQTWTDDAPAPFTSSELLPDPRKTSNDFTGQNSVPNDIRPWLIKQRPVTPSKAYDIWRAMAAERLMAAAADQVSLGEKGLLYHFLGPPSCKVEVDHGQFLSLYDRLVEGATWVFASGGRDSDTRHLLLSAEWARSFAHSGITGLGRGSLESAQAAYSAYVKSGSKETLKALADLRKAVTEDAQKATQRAQELSNALWKDLAVATAPFVIKVLPDANKLANLWLAGGFALGAALFLIFSFRTQVFLNEQYLASQERFRGVWRTRLNQVLSRQEIDEVSDAPISDSVRDYQKVRSSVGFVYAVLVIILVIFAGYQFRTAVGVEAN